MSTGHTRHPCPKAACPLLTMHPCPPHSPLTATPQLSQPGCAGCWASLCGKRVAEHVGGRMAGGVGWARVSPTLKELCTRVSSRSMTTHSLLASCGLISGRRCLTAACSRGTGVSRAATGGQRGHWGKCLFTPQSWPHKGGTWGGNPAPPVSGWGCGVTLGRAPFSSTSSGAPVVPAQGSASSRHRQQKRDWRMLRLRGFLAGVWVPAGGPRGGEG